MRRAAAVALIAVAFGACGGDESRIEGVVVGVTGGLSGVDSFEIVVEDGRRLRFVRAEGLDEFEHGGPLSHLSEHLQTGHPIRVTYVAEADSLVAVVVADAG